MKLRPLIVASALAAAALVPAVPAAADETEAPPAPARNRLEGNYTYAGGDRQRQGRDAAIEKATESMFFVTRGVARGRVKDKTEIWANVSFSFKNGMITTTMSKLPTATSPESGSTVPYKMGSDDLKLSQRLAADGKLVQSFAGSDATRTNTYVLSPDGKTLNIFITVASAKLPQPVSYVLTYVRSVS
jgi:hypothetical protein